MIQLGTVDSGTTTKKGPAICCSSARYPAGRHRGRWAGSGRRTPFAQTRPQGGGTFAGSPGPGLTCSPTRSPHLSWMRTARSCPGPFRLQAGESVRFGPEHPSCNSNRDCWLSELRPQRPPHPHPTHPPPPLPSTTTNYHHSQHPHHPCLSCHRTCQDTIATTGPGVDHPVEAVQLVVTQRAACTAGAAGAAGTACGGAHVPDDNHGGSKQLGADRRAPARPL